MIAGGALAVIIGLFLPWYSASGFGIRVSSSPGLNGTGFLLLIFSVVAVGASLNVMKQDKKNMITLTVVMAVLAVLIMLNNWPDKNLGSAVSTGIGYWLSLAGSASMLVGSGMIMKESKEKKN